MRIAFAMLGLALALAAGPARAQTTVALRPQATIAPGLPVLLQDVATLTGPDSERLGAVRLLDTATPGHGAGRASIDLPQVRGALEAAGVNWGRVAVSGTRCDLSAPDPIMAPRHAGPAGDRRAFVPVDALPPGSMRALVAARLADLYALPPADVRICFRGGRDDTAFLDRPLAAGERVEASPGSASVSGRVAIRVDIYEGARVAAARTITVDVLVRRAAARVAAPVAAGSELDAANLSTEEVWMSPAATVPPAPGQLAGQTARHALDPARAIDHDDTRSPVVVKRGESVWVHVLSGTVAMKAKARALEAGRDGDEVALQLEGSRKTFKARLSGRGTAVLECHHAGFDAGPAPQAAAGSHRTPATRRVPR